MVSQFKYRLRHYYNRLQSPTRHRARGHSYLRVFGKRREFEKYLANRELLFHFLDIRMSFKFLWLHSYFCPTTLYSLYDKWNKVFVCVKYCDESENMCENHGVCPTPNIPVLYWYVIYITIKWQSPNCRPLTPRLVMRKINKSHHSLGAVITLAMTYFVFYLWFLCRRLRRITGSRPPILILMMSRRITHHTPVTSHVTASWHNGNRWQGWHWMAQPKYDLSYLYQWNRGINPQYLTTWYIICNLVWIKDRRFSQYHFQIPARRQARAARWATATMTAWTRTARRRGSGGSGLTSPRSSCRSWRRCSRGTATPTWAPGRRSACGPTSPSPESGWVSTRSRCTATLYSTASLIIVSFHP